MFNLNQIWYFVQRSWRVYGK